MIDIDSVKKSLGSSSTCRSIISENGCCCYYITNAMPNDWDLSSLYNDIHWTQQTIKMFGKIYRQPRLVGWQGDHGVSYTYSGKKYQAASWTSQVKSIRSIVESLLNVSFNFVLLNCYRNGHDCMGRHSDDEKELGVQPIIASVSFGQSRPLVFTHKETKDKLSIDLDHNSLLIMSGLTQKQWWHELPRRKNIDSPRINMTFRQILC